MTGHVIYTYAVASPVSGLAEAVAAVGGVAGAPVRLLEESGLAAVVSPVPADEFAEGSLRAHLEDLDWLESIARSHHLVVEAASALTTVLPLRLTTIYHDDDRVREILRSRQQAFKGQLDRLADHVEWGVKLYVVPPVPTANQSASSASAPAAEVSPGRAYLRSRRREHHSREDAWRAAEEASRRIDAEARKLAIERARHRLQQGDLAQGPGQNVVNDAYLVPRDLGEEFSTRVTRAAEGFEGVRVEITGPWAPYSFAAPSEDRAEEEAYGP
ncbi:GvpL/GvpF family gas vesicle protein [Streptomyces sp. 8N706]|uniref:GvpL/GvpF family gas vesicle protein n=1 Tax=Streptomyces sp. 8N706 TaxID=3457416 RepID=UPI003FD223FF